MCSSDLVADYTEAIRIDPDDADAYYNRGEAYFYLEEYDKSISDCTEAIRIKPDYAEAYDTRGLAYRLKGESEKAMADYTEANRIKHDDALAKNTQHKTDVWRDELSTWTVAAT